MTKTRRDGYVFVTWTSDHAPRHVHVYRDGMFIAKWDLERKRVMKGRVTRRIVELICELEGEGKL